MDDVYFKLNLYALPIIIILGTFGAIANQALFYYRKVLRGTSCAVYFRALSLNDLIVLWYILLLQWLNEQYHIRPEVNSIVYCKLSLYVLNIFYNLSPNFLVLACFDRLCTSSNSARIRKIATPRVAYCLLGSTILFTMSIYIYVLIWSEIVSTPEITVCTIIHPIYSKLLALTLMIFYCFLPPVLMMIFCALTLFFLRQQRRRIMPLNQVRVRQRDNQLIKMLVIYVTTNILCILPFTINYFLQVYIYFNPSPFSSSLVQYSIILLSVTYATSFYVYTLGTPFYRDEFRNLLKDIWRKI